jgi:hypothetical protein
MLMHSLSHGIDDVRLLCGNYKRCRLRRGSRHSSSGIYILQQHSSKKSDISSSHHFSPTTMKFFAIASLIALVHPSPFTSWLNLPSSRRLRPPSPNQSPLARMSPLSVCRGREDFLSPWPLLIPPSASRLVCCQLSSCKEAPRWLNMNSGAWRRLPQGYERNPFGYGGGDELPCLGRREMQWQKHCLHDWEYSSCRRDCRERWLLELPLNGHSLDPVNPLPKIAQRDCYRYLVGNLQPWLLRQFQWAMWLSLNSLSVQGGSRFR